mmetsp:Transcript_23624/g.68009  ORF Transcript_23624/g.68009 Transcript_23624/m.68009 type:complete len:603 (+) Transcript_23624:247-2055(+)
MGEGEVCPGRDVPSARRRDFGVFHCFSYAGFALCLVVVVSNTKCAIAWSPTSGVDINTSPRPNHAQIQSFLAKPHSLRSTGRRPARSTHLQAEISSVNGEVASAGSSSTFLDESLAEVDVRHGIRTALIYDEAAGRYVSKASEGKGDYEQKIAKTGSNAYDSVLRLLSSSFLPEGVTQSYYRFMKWRILQRFINANVHVFGTQSLLLGLGIKSRNSLGLGAALNWVLKDALGKIIRMVWASQMGRKFDPDAKRWRFRSAFVFAAGNGLEVATYVFPQFFLIFATVANCCKQVSMLTSSATRNALYNSFRDGKRENIGDITAKGEAQIAVVDLLGIASGVSLSRAVGVSVQSVLTIWILLQCAEIFCMYHEIRSVVFRMLNFERMYHVVNTFVSSAADYGLEMATIPTPEDEAKSEKIFLPPCHLARRAIAFGSLGRAKLAPDELSELMQIFRKEKFLLIVGENQKSGRRIPTIQRQKGYGHKLKKAQSDAQANCHIVLHADATNADIVKSTLALSFLRRSLADSVYTDENGDAVVPPLRSQDCMEIIKEARDKTSVAFPKFLKVLSAAGWAPPARYMFGRVTMRAEWPIQGRAATVAAFPPT